MAELNNNYLPPTAPSYGAHNRAKNQSIDVFMTSKNKKGDQLQVFC